MRSLVKIFWAVLAIPFVSTAEIIQWDDHQAFVTDASAQTGFIEENWSGFAAGTDLTGLSDNGLIYRTAMTVTNAASPFSGIGTSASDGFYDETLHIQFEQAVSAFGILFYLPAVTDGSGFATWDLEVPGSGLFFSLVTPSENEYTLGFIGLSGINAEEFRFRRTFSSESTFWAPIGLAYVPAATHISEPPLALLFISVLFISFVRRKLG